MVLSKAPSDSIAVGKNNRVTVLRVEGDRVRFRVHAPLLPVACSGVPKPQGVLHHDIEFNRRVGQRFTIAGIVWLTLSAIREGSAEINVNSCDELVTIA